MGRIALCYDLHQLENVPHLKVNGVDRFKMGLWGGLVHAALDTYLLRGNAPWTLRHRYANRAVSTPAQSRCAGSLQSCLCNCCHALSHLFCPTLLQHPQMVVNSRCCQTCCRLWVHQRPQTFNGTASAVVTDLTLVVTDNRPHAVLEQNLS